MRNRPPELTTAEEDAIRSGQLIGGGIGHGPDPEEFSKGMDLLADRVTATALESLHRRVRAWQGCNIINPCFMDMTGREIATVMKKVPGNVSKLLNGKTLPSIEDLIIAKWVSGEWDVIDLPPRWEVNEAIFNSAAGVLIPALKELRDDLPLAVGTLSKQEVELIGVLHIYERQLLRTRPADHVIDG